MKFQTPILILSFIFTAQATTPIPDSPATQQPVKSETVAYGLALGATLIPLIPALLIFHDASRPANGNSTPENVTATILMGSGLIFGPSTGQYYAGSYSRGTWDMSLRGLWGLVIGLGYAEDCNTNSYCGDSEAGNFLKIVGVLGMAGWTIYSLIDTHYAVQRANGTAKAKHFGFSPELFPSSNGRLQPGMMAWMKF